MVANTLTSQLFVPLTVFIVALLVASVSFAGPVRNGNDLALAWVEADAAGRTSISTESEGVIHTFRYLQIQEIRSNNVEQFEFELSAREPSSDLNIVLFVSGSKSLKLARTLRKGDCVAVKGRVYPPRDPGIAGFTVRPAVLRHKDKCLPKRGKELRREVDPAAH
jgi:hypothetical protein